MENKSIVKMDNLSTDVNCTQEYAHFNGTYYVILVICSLAVVLNSLNIIAVWISSKKLDCHYLLVVNQSLADILFAVSYFPLFTYDITWCSYLSETVSSCLTTLMSNFVNITCALVFVNLLTIAFDHFIAIYNPLRYKVLITRKRIFIVIGSMYVLFVVAMVFPFLEALVEMHKYEDHFCDQLSKATKLMYLPISLFVVDLLILVPVYSYIFNKALSMIAENRRSPYHGQARTSSYQKALTSLWIIGTFMGFFAIDTSILYIRSFAGENSAFVLARKVSMALPSINCLCDPIIYGIRLSKVREGYIQMWRGLTNKVCSTNPDDGTFNGAAIRRRNTEFVSTDVL